MVGSMVIIVGSVVNVVENVVSVAVREPPRGWGEEVTS